MSLNVVNDKDFGDVIRTFLQQILEQMVKPLGSDVGILHMLRNWRNSCGKGTGLSLTALDRHEDAVAAYTEAATIWQKLCGVRPHLAWSFHNMGLSLAELGWSLAALGRHEAAVKVYKESAKIRQELTKTDPTVLPQLAGSFHNTGPSLAELGHHEAAVEAYKKAAKIRQELAKTDPTVLPQLAWSFHNTGPSLAELGRHEAADLAETDHTVLPELAVTFHKMGLSLAELGRQEDAVAVYKKATTFPQELAEDPAVLRLLSATPIFPEVPTPDLESAPLLPLLLVKMGKPHPPQRRRTKAERLIDEISPYLRLTVGPALEEEEEQTVIGSSSNYIRPNIDTDTELNAKLAQARSITGGKPKPIKRSYAEVDDLDDAEIKRAAKRDKKWIPKPTPEQAPPLALEQAQLVGRAGVAAVWAWVQREVEAKVGFYPVL
ncbi:hypothetical protein B0H14DRAFT_3456704 [Mycena olivaceomarginata]|nr:hypothetical protein B0H14DRAFT_3456704 [Mycena olivaceomarginata]